MAKILREGIHSAEFIVWEAHQNYTRDNAWIDAEDDHLVGEPYLQVISSGVLAPITSANVNSLSPSGENGAVPATAVFYGFLIDPVVGEETDGATANRAFLVSGPASINPAHINFPAGANANATAALKATILAAAAAKQIKVA